MSGLEFCQAAMPANSGAVWAAKAGRASAQRGGGEDAGEEEGAERVAHGNSVVLGGAVNRPAGAPAPYTGPVR